MESLSAVSPSSPSALTSLSASIRYTKVEADFLIIQSAFGGDASAGDSSTAAIDSLPKGLSLNAQEIVSKLNELLKKQLPDGIESLKPEEVTPEATADRIVSQVGSLFDAFAKQHPDLEDEELIGKFMKLARQGVEDGYGQAFDILDNLGAFSFDGVKSGIEQTKVLLDDKLGKLEQSLRQRLGLDPVSTEESVAQSTQSEILKQTGASIKVVA